MRKISENLTAILIGSVATNMWFPQFRKKDYDINCTDWSFPERLSATLGERFVIRNRDHRKILGKVDDETVDIAVHDDSSYIPFLVDANRSSKVISLFGVPLFLAKPTTLLLIKEVHSLFSRHWEKHIRDYLFLLAMVEEEYTPEEKLARDKGIEYFQKFYRRREEGKLPISKAEIEAVGPNISLLCSLAKRTDLGGRQLIQRYLVEICKGDSDEIDSI